MTKQITRKKDTGEAGNGGQFGSVERGESAVEFPQDHDKIEAFARLAKPWPMTADRAREYAEISGSKHNKIIASLADSKYPIQFEEFDTGRIVAFVKCDDVDIYVDTDEDDDDMMILEPEENPRLMERYNLECEQVDVPLSGSYSAFVYVRLTEPPGGAYPDEFGDHKLIPLDGDPAQRLDATLDAFRDDYRITQISRYQYDDEWFGYMDGLDARAIGSARPQ